MVVRSIGVPSRGKPETADRPIVKALAATAGVVVR